MMFRASKSPEPRVRFAAVAFGVVVAALGMGSSYVWAASAASPADPVAETLALPPAVALGGDFANRLPNVVLRTHEGKTVRFYDDLVRGKIVMINFMYATCKGR